MNRGAVGVVDDGGEEGVFSWLNTQNQIVSDAVTPKGATQPHLDLSSKNLLQCYMGK